MLCIVRQPTFPIHTAKAKIEPSIAGLSWAELPFPLTPSPYLMMMTMIVSWMILTKSLYAVCTVVS